jgi:signal transduction histidine kinase
LIFLEDFCSEEIFVKSALPHSEEARRQQELLDLEILDTVTELEFDDVVELASHICQKPISLVSLVDDSRQWFKASVGLGAKETSKAVSFCAHALLQNDIFEVPDSSLDQRFVDNPLVTGAPHVAFYAGAPLFGPNGFPVGTLCVIDSKPGQLSMEQKKYLKMLSRQVSHLFLLRSKHKELRQKNKELTIFSTAVNAMSEGLVVQDAKGAIVQFNPAALKVLRLSEDQLFGRTSNDEIWRTGVGVQGAMMGLRFRAENPYWISINSAPVFSDGSTTPSHAVTTFADITEQKKREQFLVHSAKFSALGEMSAGIAHEINTPLASIIVNCEVASSIIDDLQLPNDNSVVLLLREKVRKIETTSERIAAIVRGLRTFSREDQKDPSVEVMLSSIIQDTVLLCSERFKLHGVDLALDCSEDILLSCVPTRLAQVVLNLLNNSFDAVSNLQEKWVKVICTDSHSEVTLSVIDSGQGIETDIEGKMMAPFFTTKELGKGTGLGLSLSKGIVESMKGQLRYGLIDGHTSFTVTLPTLSLKMKGRARAA